MSNVEKYVLTVSSDKAKALIFAQETANELELKKSSLIEVVRSLGDYVNDEDATIRSRVIDYLSQVIGWLSTSYLSRQQIQVLCQFFCDRMEDGGSIGGLRKLLSLKKYNKEMAVMTFRALLENFQDLQTRPQSQRLQIIELLNDLMFQHRDALKEIGNESIVGMMDLVSGEKDPRNLMIMFSIMKVVMVEWDISAHAEAIFDSVFCYFPITFRPPPDDPYGISAQDLKNRLRDCIAASEYFAPFAFPQLLDKLDSTSPNVKKDVLQAIAACASSYGMTTVSKYSITLWDSLKFEVLNVQEEDLAEEALTSLQAIAICLGNEIDSTDSKTPLARYIRTITKDCNEQLREPQHKQAKPAGHILSLLSISSPVAFFLIVKAVVPPLLTLYQDADNIAKQRALLEVFVQMLGSAIAVYGTPKLPARETEIQNPLSPFKDRLFELTSQALMSAAADEISFRIVALKALLRLCLLRKYLQDNEIGMAVQYFNEIVLLEDPTGNDKLKKEAIQALVELSKIKPSLIMDITIPAFMAKLPDSCSSINADYVITLEGLAQLSVEKFVSDTLIRRLLSRLNTALNNDSTPAYPQAILSTLHYILSQQDLHHDSNLSSYHEKIVVSLTTRIVLASVGQSPATALNEETSIRILGRIATMIVRALDGHKQKSVAMQVYSLFSDDSAFTPVPFRENAERQQRLTMILSTALIAGISSSIPPQFADGENSNIQNLISEMVRLALVEDVSSIRQAILRQISLLTNKFLPSKATYDVTKSLKSLVLHLSESTTISENAIRAIFWKAKGLVLRLVYTEEVLEHLLILLSSHEHGMASARGFGLLLAPDEIMSKENGAVIRLLSKQKVFNICVPVIARDFKSAGTSLKPNYLTALSSILRYTPTEVFMSEIETILPLLLQSLDHLESEIKAATIQSLTLISQESPKAIEGHVGSLVSRLLKSAVERTTNSSGVRHNALQCLRTLPGRVKDSTLLPYKNGVTRGLLHALDDPKRYVRKEAVECRATWLIMDEPQSD